MALEVKVQAARVLRLKYLVKSKLVELLERLRRVVLLGESRVMLNVMLDVLLLKKLQLMLPVSLILLLLLLSKSLAVLLENLSLLNPLEAKSRAAPEVEGGADAIVTPELEPVAA